MEKFPGLEQFPEEDGLVPNATVDFVREGFGVLVAQDGEDLHQIQVAIALSDNPRDGFIGIYMDAEATRSLANHLLHLAKYADLGVEAEAPRG